MDGAVSQWLATEPFGPLNDTDAILLARECSVRKIKKKSELYTQGQPRDFIYVLVEGYVRQLRNFGDSDSVMVAVLGPGQMLGILGVHERKPFMLSASAITDCEAVCIPIIAIEQLWETNTGFLKAVSKMLSLHLAQSYEAITQTGYARVEQRILATLVDIGRQYGEVNGSQMSINIPLTRREIAEMSHTTVETAIRTLSRWEKIGWVVTKDRIITLQCVDCLLNKVLNRA